MEKTHLIDSNFGPLRATCRWIIEHDKRDVEIIYVGGIWSVTIRDNGKTKTSHIQGHNLIYLASVKYGMKEHDEWFNSNISRTDDKGWPSTFTGTNFVIEGKRARRSDMRVVSAVIIDWKIWIPLGLKDFVSDDIAVFMRFDDGIN